MSEGYLLDNQQPQAAERFDALSALFDPWTFAHLAAVGVGPGWRVWEVGAGSPAVPAWLVDRTAPGGSVLATDIDVSRLGSPDGVTVRRHDVGVDPPPDGPFDLVHARLVLVHVPERQNALAAMVAALAPGGWLIIEDADPALQPLVCIDADSPAAALANRLKDGFRRLLAERGVDLSFGRTLPRRLRAAGLQQVRAEAYFPVAGPECTELERATTEQIRERLVAAGLATDADVDAHLDHLRAGALDCATSPLVTAWGRKP